MTSKRPFRFGLFCGQGAGSRQAWADKARAVEAAGFSTLLLGDHLPFSLSPIAGLVLVLSVIASIVPARNAARLTIREVLAYE